MIGTLILSQVFFQASRIRSPWAKENPEGTKSADVVELVDTHV